MATGAILRRDHMSDLLARGGDAIVTTLARAADSNVAERHRLPVEYVVTGAAILVGLDMPRWLAGSHRAVMAAHATRRHALVLKACGQPGDGRVAVLARIIAGDMIWSLAYCQRAVVTTDAVGDHSYVGHARVVSIREPGY